MSARGPTALKESKGLKWIYAQGFTEQAQVYGVLHTVPEFVQTQSLGSGFGVWRTVCGMRLQ